MAQWICKYCQQEARSICVDDRAIFTHKPVGKRAETVILENFTVVDIDLPNKTVSIKLGLVGSVEELKERLEMLAEQSAQRLVQLACHHSYQLNGETCELGHTWHSRHSQKH